MLPPVRLPPRAWERRRAEGPPRVRIGLATGGKRIRTLGPTGVILVFGQGDRPNYTGFTKRFQCLHNRKVRRNLRDAPPLIWSYPRPTVLGKPGRGCDRERTRMQADYVIIGA